MTCRTLACLPALTGAYADPHGGALLSSGGTAGVDNAVLERPDLLPTPAPRVINMIQLGRALTDPTMAPPVKALYVYSSNPAAVCPNQTLVLQGLAREDLFTVVHEQVMTDTARLRRPRAAGDHLDGARGLYRSYGQFYLQLAEPGAAAAGRGPLQLGGVRRCSRAPWGWPRRTTRDARGRADPRAAGRGRRPVARHHLRAALRPRARCGSNLPRPYLPFADGAPTPPARSSLLGDGWLRAGCRRCPPGRRWPRGRPTAALAARYPLQCIVPPNRFFLNSSFSQSELLRRRQGSPTVMLAPADAAARGIADGDRVCVRERARGRRPSRPA